MGSMATLFFVFLSTMGASQIFTKNLPHSSDLIDEACAKTLHQELCKETLESFPESNKADLHELSIMALKYASLNASNIVEEIKLEILHSENATFEQCFDECSETLGDGIQQIEDSITALDSKGYVDVKTWVLAAMTDADTCKEGCNEHSLVVANSTIFSQLCSNALALVAALAA